LDQYQYQEITPRPRIPFLFGGPNRSGDDRSCLVSGHAKLELPRNESYCRKGRVLSKVLPAKVSEVLAD
jgi:hypothetical protein